MKKQFATIEEFTLWLQENTLPYNNISKWLMNCGSDNELEYQVDKLKAEGYDLNDLVADGHGYSFAGYENNGWLWEDEADLEYIKETGHKVELRKRRT